MAPRPFPSSAPPLAPFLLLLLLFACSSGADTADADTPAHEALPKGRAQPAPLPHHLQAPPSLLTPSSSSGSDGDPNQSPRVADDDEGNGLKGDEWKGGWGQRRRRGQGGEARGVNEEGISTAPRQSCKDLRSKRYISDGFCASTRPLTEAVCAEKCCGPTPAPNRQRPRNRPHKYRPHHGAAASPIPLQRSSSNHHLQPWYADYVKVWARGQNEMNSVIAGVSSDDGAEEEDNGGGNEDGDEDGGDTVEWRCVEDAVRRRRVRLLCRDGTRRTYHVKLVKSCKCVQRRKHRRRRRGRRKGRRRLGRIGGWAGRRIAREAD